MATPLKIAVLASGGGSNLQALLDRFNRSESSAARVVLVVGSRVGVGALARAHAAGVASAVVGPEQPAPLLALLAEHRVDLVVLAGYLRLVPPQVVHRFRGRIINIHPALLPAFGGSGMYGIRVHRAVLAAGVRISGATVHRVDDDYDTGEILAQWPVPVLPEDTPERLAERVLAIEHLLLPTVVESLADAKSAAGSAPVAFGPIDAAPSAEMVRRLVPALFSAHSH